MTTHATALARLTGATAAHMAPAVIALLTGILADHPDDCAGVRHLQGDATCRHYRAALVVLGVAR
jgi:hypothetical protein